jgi:hypothetical protein
MKGNKGSLTGIAARRINGIKRWHKAHQGKAKNTKKGLQKTFVPFGFSS